MQKHLIFKRILAQSKKRLYTFFVINEHIQIRILNLHLFHEFKRNHLSINFLSLLHPERLGPSLTQEQEQFDFH